MQGRLIRQVQQLSHTTGQRLSYAGSAFFVEKLCSTENVCAGGEFHSGSIYLCIFENIFLMCPTDHVTNIQTYFE